MRNINKKEKKETSSTMNAKVVVRPHSHMVLFSRNFSSCNAQGQV